MWLESEMEFSKKLQELRKQKALTQEELAQARYVSRTAVSKWESGRGYPNIDSLKFIAKFFGVTIDELLSGDEVLSIAQEDRKQREAQMCDLVFGLLDLSVALFFFVPFFGQRANGNVQAVFLLRLHVAPYLKAAYLAAVGSMATCGLLTLVLQNFMGQFWLRGKRKLSLALHAVAALVFIISSQPYAAALLFIFLLLKVSLLVKKP